MNDRVGTVYCGVVAVVVSERRIQADAQRDKDRLTKTETEP